MVEIAGVLPTQGPDRLLSNTLRVYEMVAFTSLPLNSGSEIDLLAQR